MDELTRSAIVQAAIEVRSKENNKPAENSSDQPAAIVPVSVNDLYRSLANEGILVVPKMGEWSDSWKNVNPAGILLSILLLSLGAPFWYSALGKLLQLRSLLARKDDVERVLRQTKAVDETSASKTTQLTSAQTDIKSATAAAPGSPTDSTVLTAAKAAVNAARVAESKAQSAMTAIDEINVKLDQLFKKKSD